jgi:glycosyltransferase involved in cell wall biosynthesis
MVLGISKKDTEYLNERFKNVHYLPAFHPNEKVKSLTGSGDYCLYHGNLKVQENNQAAIFLIKKVFDELQVNFKIAGTSPSDLVKKEMKKQERYELIEGPYDEQMQQLIENAHINVLPTFQPTGIKLKLLNALFNGRWVLVNPDMVKNTGLEGLCIVAESADEMKAKVAAIMQQEFTQAEIDIREKILNRYFSNETNAAQLVKLVYGVPQKAAPAAL